mmetsp:Transcript_7706/g.18288  ORF Transcript_7706/g.18288 Transcript_7706/m.18288 type:complete len:347 (-) Transcript_7706:794-1834(-)
MITLTSSVWDSSRSGELHSSVSIAVTRAGELIPLPKSHDTPSGKGGKFPPRMVSVVVVVGVPDATRAAATASSLGCTALTVGGVAESKRVKVTRAADGSERGSPSTNTVLSAPVLPVSSTASATESVACRAYAGTRARISDVETTRAETCATCTTSASPSPSTSNVGGRCAPEPGPTSAPSATAAPSSVSPKRISREAPGGKLAPLATTSHCCARSHPATPGADCSSNESRRGAAKKVKGAHRREKVAPPSTLTHTTTSSGCGHAGAAHVTVEKETKVASTSARSELCAVPSPCARAGLNWQTRPKLEGKNCEPRTVTTVLAAPPPAQSAAQAGLADSAARRAPGS